MVGGLSAGIAVFAIRAVLDFALTERPNQHRFNLRMVRVTLMIVGAVAVLLSLIGMLATGVRRHRTVVDDGRGTVIRRDGTYT